MSSSDVSRRSWEKSLHHICTHENMCVTWRNSIYRYIYLLQNRIWDVSSTKKYLRFLIYNWQIKFKTWQNIVKTNRQRLKIRLDIWYIYIFFYSLCQRVYTNNDLLLLTTILYFSFVIYKLTGSVSPNELFVSLKLS